MAAYTYTREKVPVGESVVLEVQFKDSAGNFKDPDQTPEVEITDASTITVLASTSLGVNRRGVGQYYYDFDVPEGFTPGIWNDHWTGTVDGYSISDIFDFTVSSLGSIEAAGGTVVEKEYTLEDDEIEEIYSQEEIKGILRLRKYLKNRLRSTAYKPDGTPCPLLSNGQLDLCLMSALSEFNATPTLTNLGFDNTWIQTVAADIITQGAMLIAWSAQAVIEAGFEYTINDNGVTYNPPPVSSMISSMYNTQLSDYRAKLKEIKRNLRPSPKGLSAGSLLVTSPQVIKLKHLRERRII